MSQNVGTLLIVDDEQSIRHSLRTILSSLGYEIIEAAKGEEAVALARTTRIDGVLLDIDMPGMGGIGACRNIRKTLPAVPILMLTVHGTEDNKVEALDAGADDYVTKPFHLRELTARIRASIRRTRVAEVPDSVLAIGAISLDPSRHQVTKNGRKLHLTPKQFELLQYLMEHAGGAIGHGKLLRLRGAQNMGRSWSICEPTFGNCESKSRTIRLIRNT